MNEHIERTMNFIVQQQAQFASDIQKLQESQAKTEQAVAKTAATVDRTSEAVDRTTEAVAHMTEVVAETAQVVTRLANVTHAGFTDVNAKINALVDAQIRNEENTARIEGNIDRLEENATRTDESLRNLISEVDRERRERRNGR